MNDKDNLEQALRRALAPVDAEGHVKARLLEIARHGRPAKTPGWVWRADWRWVFGLGLAGSMGLFALGLWLGTPAERSELETLAALTGLDLGYMEVLL